MPCFAECYLQKKFSKKSFTSNSTSLKNKWYGIVVTLTSKIFTCYSETSAYGYKGSHSGVLHKTRLPKSQPSLQNGFTLH